MRVPEPPFPCPFCNSAHVTLVGGGLVFLHYKCTDCSEVWTAMAAPRPSVLRPSSAASAASPALPAFGDFERPAASPQKDRLSSSAHDAGEAWCDEDEDWMLESAAPDGPSRKQKVWRH